MLKENTVIVSGTTKQSASLGCTAPIDHSIKVAQFKFIVTVKVPLSEGAVTGSKLKVPPCQQQIRQLLNKSIVMDWPIFVFYSATKATSLKCESEVLQKLKLIYALILLPKATWTNPTFIKNYTVIVPHSPCFKCFSTQSLLGIKLSPHCRFKSWINMVTFSIFIPCKKDLKLEMNQI